MRICLVATNAYDDDPRAEVLEHQLRQAGHEISLVTVGGKPRPGRTVIPSLLPTGTSLGARLRRKLQPPQTRTALRHTALLQAVLDTSPELIHPTTAGAVPVSVAAAAQLDVSVARAPQWAVDQSVDLVWSSPANPAANPPTSAHSLKFHTPDSDQSAHHPEPGRHAGVRLALAYRKTDSNPGKYLEAALRRAGATIDLHTDSIDLSQLPPDTRGVVFVEGPYPEIAVSGTAPSTVPIAFWVHHGEHHLAANLRLAERYQADLILLAHSWHLAHYFRQPVQRFPFGLASDLFDGSKPIADRQYDVAMVGAYIRGGGPYAFRGQLTTSLEAALSSTAFEQDVSADRMAEIYEEARIIPNEGGTRHFPITMRVLEAVGAGALLVTQPIPGLDQILSPDDHYVEMEDNFVPQFQRVLSDHQGIQDRVDAARAHVSDFHLYDHRVDELLAGLAAVTKTKPRTAELSRDRLQDTVDRDVEVQRILVAPDTTFVLKGRELWTNVSDPKPASYEAVVFRGDLPAEDLLLAARRYIYGRTNDRADLETFVAEHHPQATTIWTEDVARVDLMAASYRAPAT